MRKLVTVESREGNEKLRQPSKEIKDINAWVKELAEEMLSQLKPLEAVGLSAPQFGENVQLFVIEMQGIKVIMINPVIIKKKGTHQVVEECTSIPGKRYRLYRPKKVKVRGLSLYGMEHTCAGHDLLAQALCHEVDHLKGVLIDTLRI